MIFITSIYHKAHGYRKSKQIFISPSCEAAIAAKEINISNGIFDISNLPFGKIGTDEGSIVSAKDRHNDSSLGRFDRSN